MQYFKLVFAFKQLKKVSKQWLGVLAFWLKSLRGTFNLLWSSFSLMLMPHILSTWDHRRGDRRLLSCLLQWLCPVCSFSRTTTKRFMAHRTEETICFLWAWLIHCSLFWKQGKIFLLVISIFCVYGQTGIVQISGVFFFYSLPKQMLTLDESTQNESSSEGLQRVVVYYFYYLNKG